MAIVIAASLLVRSARADATAAQQRADQALEELRTALENHQRALAERGKAAARSSRSTFDGHVAENAFPYAAEHGYHPKDIVHVGGNIDFLVFDGLFEIRQGTRKPEDLTIVLADVKYGSSALTREQRAVLAAMNDGRTRGEYWKARETNGQLSYQPRTEVAPARSGKPIVGIRRIQADSFEGTPDITKPPPDVDAPN
ncbi:Holliday junction resolvase-like protein [Streptomyces netropsis]|uniref:Putative Holliday junction resolvase-like endonuclease n=1 Tax=Streptomyces netropsis TaxID=55404 RepID=A0A7W7PHT4_STRNE|nr:Holliday junction resolvase-like protein [Streptomyces netropsis]MBB4890404.1 putative Holliday junction resolvase-like endonuclease [Streptomyces netropsis]